MSFQTEQMLRAARNNDLNTVLTAIRHGADPYAKDEHGNTIAMWFAYNDNATAAATLVREYPALLAMANHYGKSPQDLFEVHQNQPALTILDHLRQVA